MRFSLGRVQHHRAGGRAGGGDRAPPSRTCAESRCMPETPIAVAMSGGVDSSTVAALLAREGRSVVGLTMQLWNQRRLPELRRRGRDGALLLARRCLRRAPRRRADRHPVLRRQLRAAVRGAGGEAVRRGVPRRPHADPVHALQQLHQVRPLSGDGGRGGRAPHRHRPLRAHPLRRGVRPLPVAARGGRYARTRPTSCSA